MQSATVRVRAFSAQSGPTEWSEAAIVEAGLLSPEDWTCSLVQGAPRKDTTVAHRPVLFRRDFDVRAKVQSARLYNSAHGLYVAEINGQRVGDHQLSPGWTSYRHELLYQTFDVLLHLKIGDNAIGAEVGEGWFCGRLGFAGGIRNIWGESLGLIAQLVIVYEDGTTEIITTDDQWKYGQGATTNAEIYDGERYDARVFPTGWSEPNFSDTDWRHVTAVALDSQILKAPDGPPVRRIEEITAVKIWESPSKKMIVDFGQNLVGWLHVSVKGRSGHTIRFTHTEVLEKEECATRPLRHAKATDELILDGGDLVWEPKFTFHGFRYVQVEDWPTEISAVSLQDFVAVAVNTDMQRTGWFECSDSMLNKLHSNVVWSMRDNFLSVPTDCPQRDERLGWTGDLQAFAPTAAFLYNPCGMLKTWLRGLAIEQKAVGTGAPPLVSPDIFNGTMHTPAAIWGDAAVMVPWDLYEASGDRSLLKSQYDSMVDWVNRGIAKDDKDLWDPSIYQLGDWLDPAAPSDDPGNGKTDSLLVANAFLIRVTDLMAKISSILGLSDKATEFDNKAATRRSAFLHEYMSPSGRLVSDTQTALALAIHFGLFPTPAQQEVAAARLCYIIRHQSRFKIATGFAGTPVLGHALSRVGQQSLFYRILLHRTFPSWLYTVSMGATTIWERWDSMLPDGSINPGEMTSFNHYALGSVADWMHKTIGGVRTVEPGWKRFSIRPIPGGGLTHATVRFESPYGLVESRWRVEGEYMFLTAVVPPNTTAEVALPGYEVKVVGSGTHELREAYEKPEWPPLPIYPPFVPHDADYP